MEIIKIGNDAMKISLCTSEAKECGLDCERAMEDARKNFISLLMKAKSIVDFKSATEKLIGEMFSARDGGCEIFVRRAEVGGELYSKASNQEIAKRAKSPSCIICFDSVNNAIFASVRLWMIGQKGGGLYYDDEGERYYIILEDVSIKDIKFAFLTEYGCEMKGNLIPYVKEHFRCICKRNAIEKLSKC